VYITLSASYTNLKIGEVNRDMGYTEIAVTLGFNVSERLGWLIFFLAIIWMIGKLLEHRK
jgi:hypothetical protein